MAHEWSKPAVTAVNCPGGASIRPASPLPQHSTVRSVRMPQVCDQPADTALNSPSGDCARPQRLLPQQSTTPSLRRPQWCSSPAETSVNGATERTSSSPATASLVDTEATV